MGKKEQLRFLLCANKVCLLAASLLCNTHKAFQNSASATLRLTPKAKLCMSVGRVGEVLTSVCFGLVGLLWFFGKVRAVLEI